MATWNIDTAHTNVGFTVKHMMVSRVRGNFNDFEGTIEGDPENLAASKIQFKVNMDSINTNNEHRDNHLRSADFLKWKSIQQWILNLRKLLKHLKMNMM